MRAPASLPGGKSAQGDALCGAFFFLGGGKRSQGYALCGADVLCIETCFSDYGAVLSMCYGTVYTLACACSCDW